eukprot:CAMPEP_0202978886 /NCGR_PEP_ID=MMETSP1396-20130829/85185_1 /ASSEMBLY_ACC=CAM_ASM_000872 /TAXON_ID= /ORGANISM="Pseudokeronopsis sp., Strain Brazil" /LENGTH=106 /DNA_ID=CAMNT_0049718057 /DNA_START=939 /DNA_END=1259 /DNA_ORIENTATION=+
MICVISTQYRRSLNEVVVGGEDVGHGGEEDDEDQGGQGKHKEEIEALNESQQVQATEGDENGAPGEDKVLVGFVGSGRVLLFVEEVQVHHQQSVQIHKYQPSAVHD